MTIRNSAATNNQINTNKPGCLLGFAVAWTVFSCGMAAIMLTNEPNIFGILFISLFIIVGLGLMIYSGMVYYTRFRVGKPDFLLSKTELRPGEKVDFSFTHTFPNNVKINWMKMQLIFRETATYQRGTDTTTVTKNHIVDEYEEAGFDFQGGHMLSKAYSFQIPEDGMHTLKVRRNALEWFVKFEADIPSLPNFVEEFELTVLPEVN
ncbi:MAG: hypothetical protein IAF02_11540 [Anaerolineae bacterium]|nr:hypothetical protein [Anaerolineae bacterium]